MVRNGTGGRCFSLGHVNMPAMSPSKLRNTMRQRRANLPAAERAPVAQAIARHLLAHPRLRPGLRIAAYHAVRGEISLLPFMQAAALRGMEIYLPCLDETRLSFRRHKTDTPLHNNRFGIPEPVSGTVCAAPFLDIVLLPLTAFDSRGTRLGQGGGYYDRTFAFLLHRRVWRKPLLVGVAYAFQHVPHLTAQPWDVPLDAVCTEQGLRVLNAS